MEIQKEEVYRRCLQLINDKIGLLHNHLQELKESIGNETKSSAGDKHETARAHLQIEQEQISRQLADVLAQKSVLELIDITQSSLVIINGSLIKTSAGYFFMSIAVGKILIDGIPVIALSLQSPLGMKLIGLKEGDRVLMNDKTYAIESIL